MGRALLLFGLSLTLSGCIEMRQAQVERDLVQQRLESQLFVLPLPTACHGIEALDATFADPGAHRSCGPCIDRVESARTDFCTYELRETAGDDPSQVVTAEQVGDAVRVRVISIDPREPPAEDELRRLWRSIDPDSARDSSRTLEADAQTAVLEEAAHFTPRSSFTAGLQITLGGGHSGVGLRGGLRRWQNPYLIYGALLEAEWALITVPWSAGRPSGALMLSLPLRAEFSLWSHWSEHTANLPENTLYILAGPLAVLDDDGVPGSGIGWRAGAGVHLVHVAHTMPCYLEVHVNHAVLAHGFAAHGVDFTFGLGL